MGASQMKVLVHAEVCQGHGRCNMKCPELFEIDDDGFARLTSEEVPPELEEAARRAADVCPESAIVLLD